MPTGLAPYFISVRNTASYPVQAGPHIHTFAPHSSAQFKAIEPECVGPHQLFQNKK